MKCPACGHDVLDNEKKCPNCGQEFNAEARPISRQEIENFDGITIESDEKQSGYDSGYGNTHKHYSDQQEQARPRVYVKQFNSGLLGTLLVGALIIAFIFFVLPTLLLVGLAIVAVWWVLRLFM